VVDVVELIYEDQVVGVGSGRVVLDDLLVQLVNRVYLRLLLSCALLRLKLLLQLRRSRDQQGQALVLTSHCRGINGHSGIPAYLFVVWEVGFEVDITGLELGDVLEDSPEEDLRPVKLILFLDIFRLMVQFDGLVLLQHKFHRFLALLVEDGIDALQFCAEDQSESVVGDLRLLLDLSFVLAHEGVVVAQRAEAGVLVAIDDFLKAEQVRLGDAHIDGALLLPVVLEQYERAEHLRQLVIVVALAQQKLPHPLHLQTQLVFFM
jgi:hypothetical protein